MITLTTAAIALVLLSALSVLNDFYVQRRTTIGGVSVFALGVAGVVSALAALAFYIPAVAIVVGLASELVRKIKARKSA